MWDILVTLLMTNSYTIVSSKCEFHVNFIGQNIQTYFAKNIRLQRAKNSPLSSQMKRKTSAV